MHSLIKLYFDRLSLFSIHADICERTVKKTTLRRNAYNPIISRQTMTL